jgi:hypothetical protein
MGDEMESGRGFLRLRQLFGAPPDAWTARHLHDAVARGEEERFDLDFKSVVYAKPESCAEDVAAMANWQGGVLVLGVEETDGRATKAALVAVSDPESLRMRQAVADRVFPTPDWDIYEALDPAGGPGAGFYVLVIPQSPSRPHAVLVNKALRYYVRDGRRNRLLSEAEVADAYRGRFLRGQTTQRRLEEVESEGLKAMTPPSPLNIVLSLALAPEVVGKRELNKDALAKMRRQPPSIITTLNLRRFTVKDEYNAHHYELHSDGCGFAAHSYGWVMGEPGKGMLWATALIRKVVFFLEALLAHVAEAGVSGEALAMLRLDAAPGTEIRLVRVYHELSNPTVEPRTWEAGDPRTVRSEHVLDLTAMASDPSQLLVATRLLLTDLFQSFHVEEGIPWITEDGKLSAQWWRPEELQQLDQKYPRGT